jgi:hypothetical protein
MAVRGGEREEVPADEAGGAGDREDQAAISNG